MGVIRAACLQMRSSTDPQENLADFQTLVTNAAREGAIYVQSPEMTGILQKNPVDLLETIKPQETDIFFAACKKLAADLGIWLHLGSTAVRLPDTQISGKAANRGALFSPNGDLVAVYDKIHMFDVAVDRDNNWQESRRYQAGDKGVVADLNGIKIGMSICYDIRFGALYRQLAQNGASVLTCPAAFTVPTGQAHWQVLLQARAIENGAFMIAAAQGGSHEDGRKTYGHSMMIDPWGKVVGELDHDEPDILVCDLDLNEVEKARQRIPSLENGRDFTMS